MYMFNMKNSFLIRYHGVTVCFALKNCYMHEIQQKLHGFSCQHIFVNADEELQIPQYVGFCDSDG